MKVWLCCRDVLVEVEDVVGVVLPLDLLQLVPARPVRSSHPSIVVIGHVVYVH